MVTCNCRQWQTIVTKMYWSCCLFLLYIDSMGQNPYGNPWMAKHFYRLTRRMRQTTVTPGFLCSYSPIHSNACLLQIKLSKASKIFNKTGELSLLSPVDCLQQELLTISEQGFKRQGMSALRPPNPVQKRSHDFKAGSSRISSTSKSWAQSPT